MSSGRTRRLEEGGGRGERGSGGGGSGGSRRGSDRGERRGSDRGGSGRYRFDSFITFIYFIVQIHLKFSIKIHLVKYILLY